MRKRMGESRLLMSCLSYRRRPVLRTYLGQIRCVTIQFISIRFFGMLPFYLFANLITTSVYIYEPCMSYLAKGRLKPEKEMHAGIFSLPCFALPFQQTMIRQLDLDFGSFLPTAIFEIITVDLFVDVAIRLSLRKSRE